MFGPLCTERVGLFWTGLTKAKVYHVLSVRRVTQMCVMHVSRISRMSLVTYVACVRYVLCVMYIPRHIELLKLLTNVWL